jgi:hypothetical protein
MRYLMAAFMAATLCGCASAGTDVKESQLAQFKVSDDNGSLSLSSHSFA